MIGRRLREASRGRPEAREWAWSVDVVFPPLDRIEAAAINPDRLPDVESAAARYAGATIVREHGRMEARSRAIVEHRLATSGYRSGQDASVVVLSEGEVIGHLFGARIGVLIWSVTTL